MAHISLEDCREYRMQECQIIVSCCMSFREKRCLLELKGMVSWCKENTVNLSPTLKKANLSWNSCVLFVGGIKHECLLLAACLSICMFCLWKAVLKAVWWILVFWAYAECLKAHFILYLLILILLFMQFILNSEMTDFRASVLNSWRSV
jgi:hypothetical protein